MSQRALRAAVEVAEQAGLRFDRPVVLGDRSNLLVRLEPAPVVARVATTTATVRAGDAWLAREVAVAGYLARLGAPVVAPSTLAPPGPHRHDGHLLTFWEYAEELDAPLDARRAGRGLHECHEALADFDGDLPPMALPREAEDLVERLSLDAEDAAILRRVGADVRRRIDALAHDARRFQGTVWTMVFALRHPEARERAAARLAWDRARG